MLSLERKKKAYHLKQMFLILYNSNELQQRCLNSNQQRRQRSGGGKGHGEVS